MARVEKKVYFQVYTIFKSVQISDKFLRQAGKRSQITPSLTFSIFLLFTIRYATF
jgi:hypothetical protein